MSKKVGELAWWDEEDFSNDAGKRFTHPLAVLFAGPGDPPYESTRTHCRIVVYAKPVDPNDGYVQGKWGVLSVRVRKNISEKEKTRLMNMYLDIVRLRLKPFLGEEDE
jgi:hypothetical protein